MDQAGVAADPAQARQARVGALQQRRRIHANFGLVARARPLGEQRVQPLQPAAHRGVVILAPGVARDPAAGRLRRPVQLRDAYDRLRRSQQIAWIVAHRGAPVRQILHFSGEACGHPAVIPGAVAGRRGRSGAGQFEAAAPRQFANLRDVHMSSPTDRISSRALLLRTTPGRMT